MGQSTDAILFYGYVWEEEGPVPPGLDDEEVLDDLEWAKKKARENGAVDPWDSFPRELEDYERRDEANAWIAEHRAEIDAFYAAQRAVEESLTVELGQHCSGEYPMPYVYVSASERRAWRGSAVQISPETMSSAGFDELLEQFVEERRIDLSDAQGPGWFLVSMWN